MMVSFIITGSCRALIYCKYINFSKHNFNFFIHFKYQNNNVKLLKINIENLLKKIQNSNKFWALTSKLTCCVW